MRYADAARVAAWPLCVVLFVALTACGLHIAERAQHDLVGVDMPVSSVNIQRLGERIYRVTLLGAAYRVDLGHEVATARRAVMETSAVSRKMARRAVAVARLVASTLVSALNEASSRLRARRPDDQGAGGKSPRSETHLQSQQQQQRPQSQSQSQSQSQAQPQRSQMQPPPRTDPQSQRRHAAGGRQEGARPASKRVLEEWIRPE
ncbi:MAG: hypothetical protein QME92_11295 [Bacillota bacterium]|nr:hypothetical protein [Bacillota bacterium]